MNLRTMTLGSYETNCYLVSDDAGNRALIDPGSDFEFLLEQIRSRPLCAILLTHGHFDHVGAVRTIAQETHCRVYLHRNELALPPSLTAGDLYYTDFYDEPDCIEIGALHFRVLHTPGHTPGSVCLLCSDKLFTGDTLFAGSCGRVDFIGGDDAQMQRSLRTLAQLPGNCDVLPGHGPHSTLHRERACNPYMIGALHT